MSAAHPIAVCLDRDLLFGCWRGLRRATRFVYLELAIQSRTANVAPSFSRWPHEPAKVELPIGLTGVDAVQDILGGRRKETKRAVRELEDCGLISFEKDAEALDTWWLVIHSGFELFVQRPEVKP